MSECPSRSSLSFSICSLPQVADPRGLYQQAPLLSCALYGLASGRRCQETGGQEESEAEIFLASAASLPGSGLTVAVLPYPTPPFLLRGSLPQWQPQLSPGPSVSRSRDALRPRDGWALGCCCPQVLLHHHPLLLSLSPSLAFESTSFLNSPRLPHQMHHRFPAKTLKTHLKCGAHVKGYP